MLQHTSPTAPGSAQSSAPVALALALGFCDALARRTPPPQEPTPTVLYGRAPDGSLTFASAVADPSALHASPADVEAFLSVDAPRPEPSPSVCLDRAWALAA